MSGNSWWGSQAARISYITGAAILLASVIIAVIARGNGTGGEKSSGPARPPSGPTSVTSSPSPGCAKKLQLTGPKDGTNVSGPKGVFAEGEACSLDGETGWLFDHDYGDGYFHEDYRQTPGPVVTGDGHWGLEDMPVGSPGDDSTVYTITLVLATPECNRALLAIKPDSQDYKVGTMPAGCQIVGERKIYVTWK